MLKKDGHLKYVEMKRGWKTLPEDVFVQSSSTHLLGWILQQGQGSRGTSAVSVP